MKYSMKFIILLIALVFAGVWVLSDSDTLKKVQSGELELYCLMQDGERQIQKEKVKGLIEGTWIFENKGYASQCRVKELE